MDALELLGYEGLFASSGIDAIQQFQENRSDIDLVILDLHLPDMTGEDVLTELRAIKPEITVLIASGYEYSQKAEKMKELKVDDYLSKPFKIGDLQKRLEKLL